MIDGHGLAAACGFPAAVYRFMRRPPLDREDAKRTVRRRLERRDALCLALLERAVFDRPQSPYHRLLRGAGCSREDFAALVGREGLEAALGALARSGVFLRIDELKGRRPVERGGERFWVRPRDVRNPLVRAAIEVSSGGSRGPRTGVGVGLEFVGDHAVDSLAALDGHGGADWRHASWTVPGGGSLINVLEFCRMGAAPARWFWQLSPETAGLDARYRWSARVLRGVAMAAGRRLPAPEVVELTDPRPIARWMHATLRAGAVPHLWTYASAAVRVCRAAREESLDVAGARFTAGGEPLTPSRREAIEALGAAVLPRYGATETDIIGYACATPTCADDQHLLEDRRAVVQVGEGGHAPDLPAETMLFTSVLPSDPLVLLNVSLGDCARLVERSCGCPLERLGWSRHLESIRSFEKLTAGGMTFLDVDVAVILEETLPRSFGGEPTDYQLVEMESSPELTLLVHPRLGPLEEGALRGVFLAALGRRGAALVMAEQWAAAGLPRVERRPPLATPAGKILHLHRDSA